ncbi:MAG: FAD-dependent oxidoreductase [bacterium]|jgi:NADPH-dependent glutamate synthase beta subunit-like oxidoreductase/Pyruvate/2-oxoacid:ferredoxin oxidoreductase delta subunit
MAKIVKKEKKGLRSLSSSAGGSSVETSPLRPVFVEKTPPCICNCPNHNQVRKVLMTIAKTDDLGKTYDQTLEESWQIFMETTPMPATMGRVCPHPCETDCNRSALEGGVEINSLERFLGDYGLAKNLKPRKLTEEKRSEKIAVIGSGPAGISCAYQLARRGYGVTIFEAFPKPGGMLRYGIPDYRLPQDILDAEINRVLAMGVELKCNTVVGKDIPYESLQKDYRAIFVGIGAHKGIKLNIPGDDAVNVFTGTEFLHRINTGQTLDVGDHVVVIGGGDTAIDAARVARRLGAKSTILYRRTRNEMPAIKEEIEGALEEGVQIEFLAAPLEITKSGDRAVGMKCQRMELGEPDASGRRKPVPIPGNTFDLAFTTLIAAISQEPDFGGAEFLKEGRDWIKTDQKMKTKAENIYAGGDDIELGIAVTAIYHGRRAAEAIHELITGEPMPELPQQEIIRHEKMKLSYYEAKKPHPSQHLPVEERLKKMDVEIVKTLSQEEAIAEAKRCLSCGLCFDCGSCWSFCQDNAIIKPVIKGQAYKFKLEFCNGCKKCAENCPCGYIEMH